MHDPDDNPAAQMRGQRRAGKPLVLVSYSRDETARALLLQTGSSDAAHQAIARNTDVLKRPKRNVPDDFLLLRAGIIQREQKCDDGTALRRVARACTTNVTAEGTLLKRLRRALKGKTLAEFCNQYEQWVQLGHLPSPLWYWE